VANRHLVIVEDYQHIRTYMTSMGQRFKCHPAGDGTITDNGYSLALYALLLGSKRHAQGSGYTGGRVAHAKGVIGTLVPFWKSRKATGSAQIVHFLHASGQNLVWVALVAYVPDQSVFRGIVEIVKGNGQLHYAQAGTKVPTRASHRIE